MTGNRRICTHAVGAALRRERAATRPQDFKVDAEIAGAALQPFRDTRPLPQRRHKAPEIQLCCKCP
ncbi:hypothetical protein FCH83_28320 [Pseudomonas putida]|nr:hypothetical protein [Pseudomonas putida]NTZ00416.1 hypothetical protein [Pseudomonas putida]NTZ25747.1 hypothetical protein [Pseudomonas putida]NTZ55178.1 hypothetical protein [Pseudomonas putida]NTZ81347.1 hypothetical protein [Pseudomonas putida]